ncbi:hypothetical protein BSKO_06208 [Bryopsis sp. KO-2023]|nr:hypothetical protein BSKO_06208 [Bryopsis sp. KO-2023]
MGCVAVSTPCKKKAGSFLKLTLSSELNFHQVQKWQSEFDGARLRLADDLKEDLKRRARSQLLFYHRKAPKLRKFCNKTMNPHKWIARAEMKGVLESPRNPLHA